MSNTPAVLCCGLIFSGLSIFASATYASAALPRQSLRPGGIAVIPLDSKTSQVWVNNQRAPIVQEVGQNYAIVGIPLDQPVGPMQVQLKAQGILKANQLTEKVLDIAAWPYREQHITVKDQSKVTPDEAQLARFNRESAGQKAVYREFLEVPPGPFPGFILPTSGIKTGTFGSRRFFNGEARAPHAGMDIKAPEGQNVKAPADGTVKITGDYFFNGRTVIIDHGQGIYSMLCHLSQIDVQPGQSLKQGDSVGRVGHTGRATGAHLHWTVSINDARVDPALLLQK